MSIHHMIQIPPSLQGILIGRPETTPGTHLVNIKLFSGVLIHGVTVVNSAVALIDPEREVETKDIQELQFQ